MSIYRIYLSVGLLAVCIAHQSAAIVQSQSFMKIKNIDLQKNEKIKTQQEDSSPFIKKPAVGLFARSWQALKRVWQKDSKKNDNKPFHSKTFEVKIKELKELKKLKDNEYLKSLDSRLKNDNLTENEMEYIKNKLKLLLPSKYKNNESPKLVNDTLLYPKLTRSMNKEAFKKKLEILKTLYNPRNIFTGLNKDLSANELKKINESSDTYNMKINNVINNFILETYFFNKLLACLEQEKVDIKELEEKIKTLTALRLQLYTPCLEDLLKNCKNLKVSEAKISLLDAIKDNYFGEINKFTNKYTNADILITSIDAIEQFVKNISQKHIDISDVKKNIESMVRQEQQRFEKITIEKTKLDLDIFKNIAPEIKKATDKHLDAISQKEAPDSLVLQIKIKNIVNQTKFNNPNLPNVILDYAQEYIVNLLDKKNDQAEPSVFGNRNSEDLKKLMLRKKAYKSLEIFEEKVLLVINKDKVLNTFEDVFKTITRLVDRYINNKILIKQLKSSIQDSIDLSSDEFGNSSIPRILTDYAQQYIIIPLTNPKLENIKSVAEDALKTFKEKVLEAIS